MNEKEKLEQKIEQLRVRMYEIYEQDLSEEELLRISRDLDELLNKLRRHSMKSSSCQ
ncbi:aspartyl-phosphate phosphatase Spo0E family protein [Halobacillus sp. BBL2006]|uniref:aspartyl-phosphate phosphatase Spo0E family protein n=1 Tax=Halobacillus sp. BBL2006 TaxID=1543706 RepID=UPI0009DED53C|nr:aspartyl-phosphate phosphatase Spo0E family protein [Halobacillus sp. BBL2006]